MGQYYEEYLIDLPQLMVSYGDIDIKIEKYIEQIANKDKDIVMEGRTVGILVYTDYSVLLYADLETKTQRFMDREHMEDFDMAKMRLIKKDSHDIKRLNRRYNMDVFNKNCYNIAIDTRDHDIRQTVDMILKEIEERKR